MKITKISVANFRLLRNVDIDLEENLSVIIGKNNCGKTSLLLILDKFLGGHPSKDNFKFDDFNVTFKDELEKKILSGVDNIEVPGINLKLFIEYSESDDLSNIGDKVIMDLLPESKIVVLSFEYYISQDNILKLRADFNDFCAKRAKDGKRERKLFDYLKDTHQTYFSITRKSVKFDLISNKPDEEQFVDLDKESIKLDNIISFKWISARRNVSNKDTDRSLSSLSAKIYQKLEGVDSNTQVIEEFKETLGDADEELDKVYGKLFQQVIDDVKTFGGIKHNESIVKIVSSLQHRDLLDQNTTVMYSVGADTHELPENYNGLGYLNLISMIFEIKLKLHDFQRQLGEKPADINLFFIEEPEAHTHPQLQRVFIKNIKNLLDRGIPFVAGQPRRLQTILTTHSSYIVSDSHFEDVKYFKREMQGVRSKNLKELKDYYSDSQHYSFLKQYLTIHRSELFFADKAIFIEGDTERILLPAMMRKIDQEDYISELKTGIENSIPLLSQNISTIEVGAYSHIFETFINFIGVKSIIITDIDSEKEQVVMKGGIPELDEKGNPKVEKSKCKVAEGKSTSNASLKYFYGKADLSYYIGMLISSKKLLKDETTKAWVTSPEGNLICAFQTEEKNQDGLNYHARSFEDSFFHCNHNFMKVHTFDNDGKFIGANKFPSLTQKYMKEFANEKLDSYDFADSAIGSKPSFAMEILLNSKNESLLVTDPQGNEINIEIEFANWNTPAYIKEALQWLKTE